MDDCSTGRNSETAEYMELVGQRAEFLEYLCDESADKRDIITNLDVSRSTVDRALNDLQDAGLVRYNEGSYETTATGVLALKQYRSHISQVKDIRAAHEALCPLGPDTRLSPAMVAGASVTITEEPRPYRALQPVESALSDATRIQALLPNIADCRYINLYRNRITAGADVELILTPALVETLKEQFPDVCQQMAAQDSFAVYETNLPSFGVAVTSDDGIQTVSIVVYTDTGSVHAVVRTGTPAAIRWATSLYDNELRTATNVTASFKRAENEPEATKSPTDHNPVVNGEAGRGHPAEIPVQSRDAEEPQRGTVSLCRLGEVAMRAGDLKTARRHTEEAVERFREADEHDFLLDGLEQLSTIYNQMEKPAQAAECCKEAVSLAKEMGLNERRRALAEKCGEFENAAAG